MRDLINYLAAEWPELLRLAWQHLYLCATALLAAISLGLLIGVFIDAVQKASTGVLKVISIIQTIPSLALLGFLIPLVGIGETPALIALSVYALLPIVLNTYVGLQATPADSLESANALGMTRWQTLTWVKLPLAATTIFAGIRTATILTIGMATLCALIGAGGLGSLIFRGISLNNSEMILAGALPASLMAIVADSLFHFHKRFPNSFWKPFTLIVSIAMLIIVSNFVGNANMWNEPGQAYRFRAAFPSEFIFREDGYQGLKATYDLDLDVKEVDIGLMYEALLSGEVDLISGFSTDGQILVNDFKVLDDDRNYFPPYYACPIMTVTSREEYPEVYEALNQLAGLLSNESMQILNADLENQGVRPQNLARKQVDTWLAEGKLHIAQPTFSNSNREPFVIASKNFPESYLLAEIFSETVRSITTVKTEVIHGMAGTKALMDGMLAEEIDCYPEYTGTGLLVMLKVEEQIQKVLMKDKDSLYSFVRKDSHESLGIDWLSPLGFNNTYSILMKRKVADSLGLKRLSQLAVPAERH